MAWFAMDCEISRLVLFFVVVHAQNKSERVPQQQNSVHGRSNTQKNKAQDQFGMYQVTDTWRHLVRGQFMSTHSPLYVLGNAREMQL
jgi:hypothetical protein